MTDLPALLDELERVCSLHDGPHLGPMLRAACVALELDPNTVLPQLLAAARRSIELDVELASLRSRVELHRQKQADAEDALRKAQHGHNGMAHDRDRLVAENERLVSFLRTHGPDLMLYTKPQVEGLKRPCRDALGKVLASLVR